MNTPKCDLCRRRHKNYKRWNVLDHLPQDQRTFIGRKRDRTWRESDPGRALSDLRTLASQLQSDHPGAAASLREGLENRPTALPSSERRRRPNRRGLGSQRASSRTSWWFLGPRFFTEHIETAYRATN